MIVTDRFVYVHLPKTGGSFVEAALQRLFADTGEPYLDTSTEEGRRRLGVGDQDQTVSEIPAGDRDRPVLFTVRDPFDHFVSFYEFAWWKDHPGDTFDEERIRRRHPHYPDLTFAEYLEANDEWDLLDEGYRRVAGPLRDAGVGPLTWEYLRFLHPRPAEALADLPALLAGGRLPAEVPAVHFLPMEELNGALADFLVARGWSPDRVAFVRTMGKVYPDHRRRAGGPWRDRYTPDLLRLVRDRERLLFAWFPRYEPASSGASR